MTTIIEAEEKAAAEEAPAVAVASAAATTAAAAAAAAKPKVEFDKAVLIDEGTGGLNQDVLQVFVKKKNKPIDIKRLPRCGQGCQMKNSIF